MDRLDSARRKPDEQLCRCPRPARRQARRHDHRAARRVRHGRRDLHVLDHVGGRRQRRDPHRARPGRSRSGLERRRHERRDGGRDRSRSRHLHRRRLRLRGAGRGRLQRQARGHDDGTRAFAAVGPGAGARVLRLGGDRQPARPGRASDRDRQGGQRLRLRPERLVDAFRLRAGLASEPGRRPVPHARYPAARPAGSRRRRRLRPRIQHRDEQPRQLHLRVHGPRPAHRLRHFDVAEQRQEPGHGWSRREWRHRPGRPRRPAVDDVRRPGHRPPHLQPAAAPKRRRPAFGRFRPDLRAGLGDCCPQPAFPRPDPLHRADGWAPQRARLLPVGPRSARRQPDQHLVLDRPGGHVAQLRWRHCTGDDHALCHGRPRLGRKHLRPLRREREVPHVHGLDERRQARREPARRAPTRRLRRISPLCEPTSSPGRCRSTATGFGRRCSSG